MTKLAHHAEANNVDVHIWPGAGAITRGYRFVYGGRIRFLEYVALAVQDGNPIALRWQQAFDILRPHEQERITFDDVSAAAGVPPSDLMGVIVATAMRHEQDVAELTVSAMQPRLVQRTAKSALRIGGKHADIAQKDRHALLAHSKFIPIPKNSTVSVSVNAISSANAKAAAAASSEPSCPSFMDDMTSLQESKESVQQHLIGEVLSDSEN